MTFDEMKMYIVLGIVGFLVLVFIRDITQKTHAIKHNFPIVGNIRYLLELIGPELRQYWVANDKEEMPFNRAERRWIYTTAKKRNNNFGFGTTELLYDPGYPLIKHAMFPFAEKDATILNNDPSLIPCLKVMGEARRRKKLFRPSSVVNVSGMSFGALSKRAISSLNRGAGLAHCYQNTGEGGVSPYHQMGGDLMWQLGTAYFGARADGKFSLEKLQATVQATPSIRCIEIKLSQGAKPGKGGILPAEKVTAEIATIRGVAEGQAVVSPNRHSEFSNAKEMILFIEKIAEATGLPVGIKSAVGEIRFWQELSSLMKKMKKGPDFITIDGSEGGTGAAPLSYTDHVSLPFKTGFTRVYTIFQKAGIADEIVWIGSGKLGFPDRTIVALAMGCDIVHVGREAMMAIGCIQAQSCHTGHCPAGVATQNWWLQRGIDVTDKSIRLQNYIEGFRKELLSLTHTAGYEHPSQFLGEDIEIGQGMNRFATLDAVLGYKKNRVKYTKMTDYSNYF